MAEDIGFRNAANALGSLVGNPLFGTLYQFGGSVACFAGTAVMLANCWAITLWLPGAAGVPGSEKTSL